jgi:hypothetical protein
MSGKQILNVGISSPEESLAHFAKVWKDAAGGKKVKPHNGIGFCCWLSKRAYIWRNAMFFGDQKHKRH